MNIEQRTPQSLTPYLKNAKIHTTEQIDRIAGQIAAFGFDQPIVVDKNGVIIKGHGRREAAIRLNLPFVPVVVAEHLDEYQAMAARIADNKVAQTGFDNELLRFDVHTLDSHNFDLNLTGMDQAGLDILMAPLGTGVTDLSGEWAGMPEFVNEDNCHRKIVVSFGDEKAVADFFSLIGQQHTDKTKSIWFPFKADRDLASVEYGDGQKS